MKLTHLDLTNFRSFRGTSVPLDASRCLIAGVNGSGKSTCQDAIAWALIGSCRGTDARGAGAEVLIPEGGKVAEVAVTVEGIGRISRSYAEKGGGAFSVEGFTGSSQVQANALFMKLGTTPEFLRACLDTSVFLDLSHVEAKAMVLSLLGVKFNIDGKDLTLDELDMHYKQAFEHRKSAKKALANCVVPAKPQGQMPTVEAITAQLLKLRTAYADLKQQTGKVSGRREALQGELARLQVTADAPAGEDLSGQIDGLQTKLAALEAAVVPAKVQAPKKGDPARVTFLKDHAAALEAHVPSEGCVLDARVACLTPTKQFQMAAGDCRREAEALGQFVAIAPPVPTESPLTAVRRRLQDLQQQQARRLNLALSVKQAQDRSQAIRQELDGLPDTASQESEIATVETRIAKGEQLLRDARMHWHGVELYADAVTRQQIQKTEVDRLEALVEQLGPNGVRVKALAEALCTVEAAVNPYVQPFGWTITFSVEPWDVLANGRPVETYSRSERYRIGIALQMGIAMMSGLKFAIIDEIDMLDAVNRAIVTKMLLSAPLDQILILGTREPSQALPKIPGVVAYRLEKSGQSSIVSERSAA